MSRRKFDDVKPVSGIVQLLEKQVTAADHGVRRVGINSVPSLSVPSNQFVELNEKLIEHENYYVRRACADVVALSVLNGSGKLAVASLGKFLADEEDPETRRCAGYALGAIARQPEKPGPEPLLGEVVPAVSAEEQAVKDRVSEAAAAEVAAVLVHENPRVRETAVAAFGGLGKWAGTQGAAFAARLSDEDVLVRQAVVSAVDRLGAFISGASRDMAKNFEHEELAVRQSTKRALVTLGKHDGPAAAAGAASMLRSVDVSTRRSAAECLQEIGSPSSAHCEEIAHLLEDADAGIRMLCSRVLFAAGKKVKPCLKSVMRKMEHADEDVSRAATDCMRTLSRIIEKFARSQGRLFIEDQPGLDPEVATQRKLRAIRVLGGAGKNALPYLEEVVYNLESLDWRLRREAMQCMVDLGPHATGKGAKEVARRLLHAEPDVRRVAAQTLGAMGVHTGGYCHRVEDLLDTEEDEDVCQACKEAVAKLRKSGAFAASEPASPTSPMADRSSSGTFFKR